MPTANLIELAHDGFHYAKRLANGLYVGHPQKAGSTHRLIAKTPNPRMLKNQTIPGLIRCVYADPDKPIDFTGPHRFLNALEWVESRKAIAASAAPLSCVAVPRGKRYKTFCAERAEAAANGSLYDKKPTHKMPKVKPAAPAKKTSAPKVAKDTKNGITRPKAGSTTGKVWDLADRFDGDRAKTLAEAAKKGINEATAMTQHGKWRKYNGIVGRTAAPKGKPAAKKKPAPPVKKKAPKAPPAPTADVSESSEASNG